MALVTTVIATLAIAYIGYSIVQYRNARIKFKDFPCAFPVPILGNVYSLEAVQFIRYLITLRKRYGKMFTYWAFTKTYLVICDPVVARRVLSDAKLFTKGKDYTEVFGFVFGEGLVTSEGTRHKKDRALFTKYFMKANVLSFVGTMNKEVTQLVDETFTAKINALPNPDDGISVDIEEFFAVLALRVFMNFCVSSNLKDKPHREQLLCSMVSRGSSAVGDMMIMNLPSWLLKNETLLRMIPTCKLPLDTRQEVMSDMMPIIQERRAAMDRGEDVKEDCLTIMLREKMSEQVMSDHMLTLICAGHDTTAYFSSFLCYLLAANIEEQDKLREEIFRVVGDSTDITADHIPQMHYLRKVMQETLRLFATIPILTRYCVKETYIEEANVTIPKCNVMVPLNIMNRDKDIWGDPTVFRPSRWEDKTSNINEFTSAKDGFFPFGFATRICIGNYLAQTEASVFVCTIMRQYRFEPKPGYKVNITSGISLTTNNGVHVNIKKL